MCFDILSCDEILRKIHKQGNSNFFQKTSNILRLNQTDESIFVKILTSSTFLLITYDFFVIWKHFELISNLIRFLWVFVNSSGGGNTIQLVIKQNSNILPNCQTIITEVIGPDGWDVAFVESTTEVPDVKFVNSICDKFQEFISLSHSWLNRFLFTY